MANILSTSAPVKPFTMCGIMGMVNGIKVVFIGKFLLSLAMYKIQLQIQGLLNDDFI